MLRLGDRHPPDHRPPRAAAADRAPGRPARRGHRRHRRLQRDHYRLSPFYDLAKVAVIRLAWAQATSSPARRDRGGADAGLAALGDDARAPSASPRPTGATPRAKSPHFAISETPRFVGRAVAALAADPDRARWNGQSLSSGQLAQVYGFTDLDGSRPDAWRYIVEVQDAGKPAERPAIARSGDGRVAPPQLRGPHPDSTAAPAANSSRTEIP